MLIVVERRETFHLYYPMGVHAPGDLTVTKREKRPFSKGKTGQTSLKIIYKVSGVCLLVTLGNLTYETGNGSHNTDYRYNNLNQEVERSADG